MTTRMNIRLAWSLAVAALLIASADVQAQESGTQRVGVVRLAFEGSVPEAGQDLFAKKLVDGLAAARFTVLAGDALERRLRTVGADPCVHESCYADMARALGVGYLVVGRVGERDKTYDIRLELLNGRTTKSLASVHEECETCGIEEAAEKMNLAASALRARLEAVTRFPARFLIRSSPAAARASIDGKPVGRTPLDVEVGGGEHHLTLEMPGYDPLNRTFIAVSSVDETLDLEMLKEPSSFPYKAIGWTGIASGVLAILGGAVALSVNGNEISCEDSMRDLKNHCPRVYKTDVLGGVLLGVGSAAAAIGGISLYMGSRSDGGGESTAYNEIGFSWHGKF